MGPFAQERLDQLNQLKSRLERAQGKLQMVERFKLVMERPEMKFIVTEIELGISDLTNTMVSRNASDEQRRECAAEIRALRGILGTMLGKRPQIDQLIRESDTLKRDIGELEKSLGPIAQRKE